MSKLGKGKYSRGHHVKGQWVLGGVERGSGKKKSLSRRAQMEQQKHRYILSSS